MLRGGEGGVEIRARPAERAVGIVAEQAHLKITYGSGSSYGSGKIGNAGQAYAESPSVVSVRLVVLDNAMKEPRGNCIVAIIVPMCAFLHRQPFSR